MKRAEWADASFAALSKDDLLAPFVKRAGLPTIVPQKDAFKVLVRSVVGQQLSGRAGAAIYARLEASVGELTASALASASPEGLRAVGLSRNKAETLLALAEAAGNGLDFGGLEKLSDDAILEALVSIRGIGAWTAEMFLMFALARQDIMSAGDLGLRKGLKVVYGLSDLPRPKDCPELFERWRPYRTAASWYLWELLEERDT